MAYLEELRQLIRRKSLVRGEIVLSSGRKSRYYLDCKLTTLDPRGAFLTGHVILELLEAHGIKADAIGGMSMGADPIVSAVSVISHSKNTPLPGFLIRREAKQHGLRKQIEGIGPGAVRDVVIVDEVCTTGKSTQEAIDAATKQGYRVVAVLSLVDRQEGGSDDLRRRYNYFSVFTADQLLTTDDGHTTESTGGIPRSSDAETAIHK